jgi:hypothetical protein
MVTNTFAVKAGLVDLVNGIVPSWSRSSPVVLEKIVDGSIQHYPISAHHPAFQVEDGAFVLEPAGANLCTHNLDLSQNVWQKGGQVTVRSDYAPAPDTSYRADQVTWSTGSGAAQILRRTFRLEAGQEYVIQAFLKLKGGSFASNDVMRVAGLNIAAPAQVSLSVLNGSLNQYKKLQLKFRVAGKQPKLPATTHELPSFTTAQVNTNNLTIVIPPGFNVGSNDFEGGRLTTANNRVYRIAGNTAVTNGQVIITTQEATLVADGVIVGSKVVVTNPEGLNVDIEFYSESTATIDWGGLDIKQGNFFTSPIYQEGAVKPRSESSLSWRHSPFADLKSFGFYGDVKYWEGDGGLFESGNFSGEIINQKLVIKAGGTTLSLAEVLPSSFRFFIQVQESLGIITVYVNNVLRAQGAVANFRASNSVPFALKSDAVRVWRDLLVREETTIEGQPTLGAAAQEEVLELFQNPVPILAQEISAYTPVVQLPPVLVPGKSAPAAATIVSGVNVSGVNTNLVVGNINGFLSNMIVDVIRGTTLVSRASILSATGNTIVVAGQPGILLGDMLQINNTIVPGTASVRFPADPIAPFTITNIDVGNRRLTISSVLSFTTARAFVRTDNYQDVAEVLIQSIDPIASTLTVENVTGITTGMVIFQPMNELMVEPANYKPELVEDLDGVVIGERYRNGIVVFNSNPFPVMVTPILKVAL